MRVAATLIRCVVSVAQELEVKVGVHQGSVLSLFFFGIVIDRLRD